jgi:hypothetical protein
MPRNRRTLNALDAYHGYLVGVAQKTIQGLQQGWDIRYSDAGAAWDEFIELALPLTEGAQAQAQALAEGFFTVAQELEVGRPSDVDPLENVVGFTAAGTALADLLESSKAGFLHALRTQRFEDAERKARADLLGRIDYEILSASSRELVHQIEGSDHAIGFRSKSRGTCGGCMTLDSGRTQVPRPPFHPNCRCIVDPVFRVRESVHRTTGRQRFEAMTPEERSASIGKEASSLIDQGKVSLDDLVAVDSFEGRDNWYVQRPLKDLLVLANAVGEE